MTGNDTIILETDVVVKTIAMFVYPSIYSNFNVMFKDVLMHEYLISKNALFNSVRMEYLRKIKKDVKK